MNFETIQERLAESFDFEFKGGVTALDIAQKEDFFGQKYPADYRHYLIAFGAGYVSSEEFIGIGSEKHLNADFVAERLRQASKFAVFPVNLVPVRGDGFGNYDCIDMHQSSEDTSIVVEWIHDAPENQSCRILARGFWNWMSEILDMIEKLDSE